MVGIVTFFATPQIKSVWATANMSPDQQEALERSVYYAGCSEARSAGAAPIYQGQPGYREGLDGDGDGVACEPYRGQ